MRPDQPLPRKVISPQFLREYTTQEIALRVGVDERLVRAAVILGFLPARVVLDGSGRPRLYLVDAAEAETFVANQQQRIDRERQRIREAAGETHE